MKEIFVLVLGIVWITQGYSNGNAIGICDVKAAYGCIPEKWGSIAGFQDRKNCTMPDYRTMSWASAPVLTPALELSAFINGVPVNSYPPGGHVLEIRLSVKKATHYWRGVLLYADDSKNAAVGSWKFLDNLVVPNFHVSSCGPSKLLHANAEVYDYLILLPFEDEND
jgi:hypothetical protein